MHIAIMEELRQYSIQSFLRKKQDEVSDVKILMTDFLGKKDKFYSLLIAYNATQIFNADLSSLQQNNSIISGLIEENMRVFDTKEEWFRGRYTEQEYFALKQKLKMFATFTTNVEYKGFKLDRVVVTYNPVVLLTIFYKYSGVQRKPINVLYGGKLVLQYQYNEIGELSDFTGFLEKIGLQDLLIIQPVRVHDDIRLLEMET